MQGNNVVKSGLSNKGRAQARNLIAATSATQAMLEATIEITGVQPDVKYRPGRYGDLAFVRSNFSFIRFFVVSRKTGECWKCTCGETEKQPCRHIKQVWRFLSRQQEIAVA